MSSNESKYKNHKIKMISRWLLYKLKVQSLSSALLSGDKEEETCELTKSIIIIKYFIFCTHYIICFFIVNILGC